MSCNANTEILEGLYEEILSNLCTANLTFNTGHSLKQLEEIAATEAYKRFEDLAQ